MKRGLMLITLMMLMGACSSKDVSESKVDTANELSPQTITLEPSQMITENELLESNQDIKLINSENNSNVETQNLLSTEVAEEDEIQTLFHESSELLAEEKEAIPAADSIIIGDSEYINMMHEEKFQDWISVAEKYGAALYAIPYSDVFAIVKDEEVLVGMSTGVASAAPNHLDILSDVMVHKEEAAEKIIESINTVAQTGESVHGDDFSIEMQDGWIVVSW
jgi:predicted RND superfamily exporter protein